MGTKSTKKLATHLILAVALLLSATCAQPLNMGGPLTREPGFPGVLIPPQGGEGGIISPPDDGGNMHGPREPGFGGIGSGSDNFGGYGGAIGGTGNYGGISGDSSRTGNYGGIGGDSGRTGNYGDIGGDSSRTGNYGGIGGDSTRSGNYGGIGGDNSRSGNYGGIGGVSSGTGNYGGNGGIGNFGGIGGPTPSGNGNFGGATNYNNNFCTRVAAMPKSCPSPPTTDTLDIGTLMGTYYEVGATASFKLRNELGVACTRTNFSFPQPSYGPTRNGEGGGGVVIDVENSGIPILESRPSTMSALSRMGMSTSNVCRSAARLCSSNLLFEALVRLSAITNELPSDSLMLSQASSVIQAAISGLHRRIDSVVRLTTEISRTIAAISQSGSSNAAINPLLRSLRSTAFAANSQLRELAGSTVANLTTARNSIARVANRLSDPNAISLLMGTANLLHVQIEAVITEVSRVEQTISNIGGPLTDIIAADAAGRNMAQTVPNNDLFHRVVISYGEATQENPNEPGNFTLRLQLERFNQSSPYQTFAEGRNAVQDTVSESSDDEDVITMPYKIIGLDGSPGMEYWSVLVHSCVPDPEGGPLPLSDLVLLSRAPSLPLRSIVGLLDVASRYGIPTDCSSAFVPTLQTISDDHGHQYTCAA